MSDITRLPGPNTDFWDWQLDAMCRDMDSNIFYHPDGERGTSRERRVATAKAICASCPVLTQCREHALTVREPYGIWGGMSEEEREALYRRMNRSAIIS